MAKANIEKCAIAPTTFNFGFGKMLFSPTVSRLILVNFPVQQRWQRFRNWLIEEAALQLSLSRCKKSGLTAFYRWWCLNGQKGFIFSIDETF